LAAIALPAVFKPNLCYFLFYPLAAFIGEEALDRDHFFSIMWKSVSIRPDAGGSRRRFGIRQPHFADVLQGDDRLSAWRRNRALKWLNAA
jgi:hypothetical protein